MLGAAPDSHHDRHRRGETERAGAGDDEDRDGCNEAVGEPRLGTPDGPCEEGERRHTDHGGHEVTRDLVGQSLDWGAAALGLSHELDDPRQHGVVPDLLRLDHEAAGLVHRPSDRRRPDFLGNRHRLARDHRLVDRAVPLDDDAVDRDLLARPHPQAVADLHGVELDFLLGAVGHDPAGGLGREVEQGANGPAGALPCPQFEHLPEQDENRDDGGRFEVHGYRSVMAADCGRENPGRQRRHHTVDPGHARTHGDEREHVEVARNQRLPAAHEERPASPQHDRRREQHLDPVRGLLADVVAQARQVPTHFQRDHGQGERQSDPEPARHVDQFVAGAGFRRREHGFERHAADRAGTGSHLPDLGVHRAGIDRAFRRGGRLPGRRRLDVVGWLGHEF